MKAMGQYWQGLIMYPFESKMFSNLMVTLQKVNMGDTAMVLFK